MANHPLGQLCERILAGKIQSIFFGGVFGLGAPRLGTMENWLFVYAGPHPRAPHGSTLSLKSCADDVWFQGHIQGHRLL